LGYADLEVDEVPVVDAELNIGGSLRGNGYGGVDRFTVETAGFHGQGDGAAFTAGGGSRGLVDLLRPRSLPGDEIVDAAVRESLAGDRAGGLGKGQLRSAILAERVRSTKARPGWR
jgi:hypothetical protein